MSYHVRPMAIYVSPLRGKRHIDTVTKVRCRCALQNAAPDRRFDRKLSSKRCLNGRTFALEYREM